MGYIAETESRQAKVFFERMNINIFKQITPLKNEKYECLHNFF